MAMGVSKDVLIKPDVVPKQDVAFPIDLGATIDNEMAKSFRHSWESQNVDVHSQALIIVMNALANFKTELQFNTHTFLKLVDNLIPMHTIETHLVDFDMLTNKNFDGLQLFRKSASINPNNYAGTPLLVNLRMYNMNYDKYRLLCRIGNFFVKGEGDINYVNAMDNESMQDKSFSHITEFKVKQLCFRNLNNDSEQVLFGG